MAYCSPLMATGAKDVWIFRIVNQDTGKPAQGVPVTVLDSSGNPAGYWVSEADGTVAIPRRDAAKLRLRVGLRSEDPIELNTATLGEGATALAAPPRRPQRAPGGDERAEPGAPGGRPAEPAEVPGHVLYFQRLALLAEQAGDAAPGGAELVADFFAVPSEQGTAPRYGALIEVEVYGQSLGTAKKSATKIGRAHV